MLSRNVPQEAILNDGQIIGYKKTNYQNHEGRLQIFYPPPLNTSKTAHMHYQVY